MRRELGVLAMTILLALVAILLTGCRSSEPVARPTPIWRSSLTATPVSFTTPTMLNGPTPKSSGATHSPDLDSGDRVEIAVSKDVYQTGEAITHTIANGLDTSVYYVYGCSWPVVYKVEDDGLTSLIVSKVESVPFPTEVKPGESKTCSWDQRAWQDPDQQGEARFQSAIELVQVPKGHYQFVLTYYLDTADALSSEDGKITRSRIISIE